MKKFILFTLIPGLLLLISACSKKSTVHSHEEGICQCTTGLDAKLAQKLARDYACDHKKLGDRYFRSGKYREAKLSYHRAIAIDPTYAEAYYMLGLTYIKLGEKQKAVEIFEEGLKMNPGHRKLKKMIRKIKKNAPGD